MRPKNTWHQTVKGELKTLHHTWGTIQKCHAGDVAWLSSYHMSNPSPSPLHNDGAHVVLVARVRRYWLEMVSGHNINRILLRFLVRKVDSMLRSLSVILQHSELYSMGYSLSLVLVVHWDDFHTLFSILKTFLALLKQSLRLLLAPPSCLTA